MAFECIISAEPGFLGDGAKGPLECAGWSSPGRSFMPESKYKLLVTFNEDDVGGDLAPYIESLFGTPPLGTKLWFRMRIISAAGLPSAWLYTTAIVVPP